MMLTSAPVSDAKALKVRARALIGLRCRASARRSGRGRVPCHRHACKERPSLYERRICESSSCHVARIRSCMLGLELTVTQPLTGALQGFMRQRHDSTATGHSKTVDTACLEAQLGLVGSGVP